MSSSRLVSSAGLPAVSSWPRPSTWSPTSCSYRSYGLVAAAWTTVASEVVLFVPFAVIVRRSLGTLPFWREALAPLIGGLASAAVALGISRLGGPSLVVVGAALSVYAVVWLAQRPLDRAEWRLVTSLWRRAEPR